MSMKKKKKKHVSLQSRLHKVTPPTDENFGGGVVHSDGLEDGGAIVGHRDRAVLPTAQQDLVLWEEETRGVSPPNHNHT